VAPRNAVAGPATAPPLYLAANKITPVALALALSAIPGAVVRDLPPA
jgi:hypothetical protein